LRTDIGKRPVSVVMEKRQTVAVAVGAWCAIRDDAVASPICSCQPLVNCRVGRFLRVPERF
jgi:hypothetical protein